ncbi:TetR/AcrR family transcriptional regulator [Rhodococcus marinonascens]|uniref:TetR/AcrR family transcriptional regulator n=1 Tax=Rhodococcus marinonascens TaxID=38311 RepID=UPI0009341B59|nr:TetR/AcrR family transcriptional regulator [Rhodococcus marinonascens]
MQTPKAGLRYRKRAETRARIEDAAVTLVLSEGLENATVDAISELADISPRTFFNYFDSKDSAILGLRHLDFAEEELEELGHRHGLDPIESVVRLLMAVMDPPRSRPSMREDRLEIIRRHPQLLGGQLAQMTTMASQLTGAAQSVFAGDPRAAGHSPAELAVWGELTVALCASAIRVTVRDWATNGGDASVAGIEQRAISLARELVRKLQ